MNRTLLPLFLQLTLAFATVQIANAQCVGCVADITCSISPAFPTLCPAQPPEATAGEYYETDITFWLPTTFTDPGTGFNVSFQQMTITSVTGLPFGLSLQTSSPDDIFYPQQSQYGCGRICGTPVGPGTFEVTISIIAGVVFSGISVDAPQQFSIPLVVLPGSGANSSFAFTPSSGCGSVDVDFQSLIDASPAPMTWNWDLGNGNTSTLAQPPTQTYSEPGSYSVSLETTILSYFLNTVSITGVNGSWCGDVEEPFCNCGTPIIGTCPDIYFTLNNLNGPVYTSATADGTTSHVWSGLGIALQDPPYSITVWDEDAVSQNDNLGTYDLVLTPGGNYIFNVAGGTAGALDVALVPTQTFNDTDVVTVFPLPELLITQQPSGQLCVSDTSVVGYVWYMDGDTIVDAAGPCVLPTGPGLYWVVGTNGFGCSAFSDTLVICPQVAIVRNGPLLSVPDGFNSYIWSFGGSALPNGNGPSVQAGADGIYSVVVQAANGCELTATFEYSTVGIDELEAAGGGMFAYPVPNNGQFTVEAAGLSGATAGLRVVDLEGRVVLERQEPLSLGRMRSAVLLDIAPGNYVVQVWDEQRSFSQRILVK